MIIGDRVFNELVDERIVCITGHLSGGKTRLAFEFALPYWRRGYRVISNVGHNFKNWMGDGNGDLFRSFVIADEGAEYVRSSKLSSAITRSAGKADYFVIFAGKRMPHKDLQTVIIKPRFDFWANYGIPAILWRVKVKTDEPYKFNFWQLFPQAMHGTYSTRTSSAGLENIIQMANVTVTRLAEMEGQTAGVAADAGVETLADDIAAGVTGFDG